MEFYTAVKKNEFINFADKWIKLENIMSNEVTQTQKDKSHMFSLICSSYFQIFRCEYTTWSYYKGAGTGVRGE